MGFFSWITSDTKESISNRHTEQGALPVFLVTPDNKFIYENDYDGYGRFGGFDAYALLAEWNKPELVTGDVEHDREVGIDYCFDNKMNKFPLKFATTKKLSYEQLEACTQCPDQGYFYDDSRDDDYDENDNWEYDEDY